MKIFGHAQVVEKTSTGTVSLLVIRVCRGQIAGKRNAFEVTP